MFTRCPDCGTIFRVTAAQLGAARGNVRCGGCARTFNALDDLMDELPPSAQEPGPPDAEPAPADETGTEGSLEFDAPEPTWSTIFIDEENAPDAAIKHDTEHDDPLEDLTADPRDWEMLLPDEADDDDPVFVLGEAAADAPDTGDPPGDDGTAADLDAAADTANGGETPAADAADQPAGTQAPAWLGDEPAEALPIDTELPPWLAGDEPEPEPRDAEGGDQDRRWLIAAVGLALLLCLQLTHINRDALATHPRFGDTVRSLYARLDARLYPDWDLGAYEVSGSEAVAGRYGEDTLDILARIEIGGRQAVGLPLLRVVLQDRWSNVVASGVFTPRQYAVSNTADVSTVVPGATVPVRVRVRDPGAEAQGYVVDVCLPRRHGGIDCQNARDPFGS